jgi:hypothetical protein
LTNAFPGQITRPARPTTCRSSIRKMSTPTRTEIPPQPPPRINFEKNSNSLATRGRSARPASLIPRRRQYRSPPDGLEETHSFSFGP